MTGLDLGPQHGIVHKAQKKTEKTEMSNAECTIAPALPEPLLAPMAGLAGASGGPPRRCRIPGLGDDLDLDPDLDEHLGENLGVDPHVVDPHVVDPHVVDPHRG